MLEIIEEVIHDSIFMLPVLFFAYLFIEWYEHRNGQNKRMYELLEKYGPIFGAGFGIVPQCGFSVIAATLFVEKKITLGTLISVFIATSDEAIPILISQPKMVPIVLEIILIKIVVAIVVGYLVDIILKKYRYYQGTYSKKMVDHEHHHSIWKTAFTRTFKIFGFILLVNFILTSLVTLLGEDNLAKLLFSGNFLQPIFSALFGFIPNCVASIVLTQLYAGDILSFPALIAGLITNAGLGLLVLLNYRISRKSFLLICFILFASAVLSGGVMSLF